MSKHIFLALKKKIHEELESEKIAKKAVEILDIDDDNFQAEISTEKLKRFWDELKNSDYYPSSSELSFGNWQNGDYLPVIPELFIFLANLKMVYFYSKMKPRRCLPKDRALKLKEKWLHYLINKKNEEILQKGIVNEELLTLIDKLKEINIPFYLESTYQEIYELYQAEYKELISQTSQKLLREIKDNEEKLDEEDSSQLLKILSFYRSSIEDDKYYSYSILGGYLELL